MLNRSHGCTSVLELAGGRALCSKPHCGREFKCQCGPVEPYLFAMAVRDPVKFPNHAGRGCAASTTGGDTKFWCQPILNRYSSSSSPSNSVNLYRFIIIYPRLVRLWPAPQSIADADRADVSQVLWSDHLTRSVSWTADNVVHRHVADVPR